MATSLYFPPEIIEEILYRLPVKTLGRFKCVSKQWKALISGFWFVNAQFDCSNRLHHETLLLVSDKHSLYSVDLIDLKDSAISEVVATELPFLPPVTTLTGSYDGLTTATFNKDDITMFLINPITREYMEVPSGIYLLLPEDFILDIVEMHGFGYEWFTDNYKLVSIVQCYVKNVGRIRLLVVHSTRSNRVMMCTQPPHYHTHHAFMKGVYLNGCLHWLCNKGSDSSWCVVVFNLQNDKFEEIGLPVNSEVAENVLWKHSLVVVSGCLCLVACWSEYLTQLWVMKRYGVRESWEKISIYGLYTSVVEPLYLLGDREVVLKVFYFEDELVVYNVDDETLREVKISGIPSMFDIGGTCVESLFTPTYGNRLEGDLEG